MPAPKTFATGFETYTVTGNSVGNGGSGTVYRVVSTDKQVYAVKVLDKAKTSQQKLKRFQKEIQFCQRSSSPHIIRVVDYGLAPDGSLFYVMPYYESTLREQMKRVLHSNELLRMYVQVLDSVEAAHLLCVCHRDLKPENVLYDPVTNRLVLADFGIAYFQEDELLATRVVTGPHERLANFDYSAPEQHVRGKTVDHRADIYALGLILNEMFTHRIPYGTGYQEIKALAPDFAYLDGLVHVMLNQEPDQRPRSVTAVKEDLIGRGNEFVRLQQLDSLKREVVPDSEVSDRIITDPIRAVEKMDYENGALILRLNQSINAGWEACFRKRWTSFSVNASSAQVVFHGDRVYIHVTEHFVHDGLAFFKQYCADANEEYVRCIKEEHAKTIAVHRNELQRRVRENERKTKLLNSIEL